MSDREVRFGIYGELEAEIAIAGWAIAIQNRRNCRVFLLDSRAMAMLFTPPLTYHLVCTDGF